MVQLAAWRTAGRWHPHVPPVLLRTDAKQLRNQANVMLGISAVFRLECIENITALEVDLIEKIGLPYVRCYPDKSSFSAPVRASGRVFQKSGVCPGFTHWNPPMTTCFKKLIRNITGTF